MDLELVFAVGMTLEELSQLKHTQSVVECAWVKIRHLNCCHVQPCKQLEYNLYNDVNTSIVTVQQTTCKTREWICAAAYDGYGRFFEGVVRHMDMFLDLEGVAGGEIIFGLFRVK